MFVVAGEFQLSFGNPEIREQPPWRGMVRMATIKVVISGCCPGLGKRGQEEKVEREGLDAFWRSQGRRVGLLGSVIY